MESFILFYSFYSKRQGKSFEVNQCLVYGMRTLQKRYAGARKFCSIMNMPPPPTEKAFRSNSCIIGCYIKAIAMDSIKKAGEKVFPLKKQSISSENERALWCFM